MRPIIVVSLCFALAAPDLASAAPAAGQAALRQPAPSGKLARRSQRLAKRWAKRLAVGLIGASVLGQQSLAGAQPLFLPAHVGQEIAIQGAQAKAAPLELRVSRLLSVDADTFAKAMTNITGLSSPLDASKGQAPISSVFGTRFHPVKRVWRQHSGYDFAVHKAPLYAMQKGEVVFSGWKGGYGRAVIVESESGMQYLFGHLAKIQVKKGQKVDSGQRVGTSGNSGVGTGYHLHFEVRKDGKAVDPLPYLRAAGGFAEWYRAGAAPKFETNFNVHPSILYY